MLRLFARNAFEIQNSQSSDSELNNPVCVCLSMWFVVFVLIHTSMNVIFFCNTGMKLVSNTLRCRFNYVYQCMFMRQKAATCSAEANNNIMCKKIWEEKKTIHRIRTTKLTAFTLNNAIKYVYTYRSRRYCVFRSDWMKCFRRV